MGLPVSDMNGETIRVVNWRTNQAKGDEEEESVIWCRDLGRFDIQRWQEHLPSHCDIQKRLPHISQCCLGDGAALGWEPLSKQKVGFYLGSHISFSRWSLGTYFWSKELLLASTKEGQVEEGVRVELLKLDTEGSRPMGDRSDNWKKTEQGKWDSDGCKDLCSEQLWQPGTSHSHISCVSGLSRKQFLQIFYGLSVTIGIKISTKEARLAFHIYKICLYFILL